MEVRSDYDYCCTYFQCLSLVVDFIFQQRIVVEHISSLRVCILTQMYAPNNNLLKEMYNLSVVSFLIPLFLFSLDIANHLILCWVKHMNWSDKMKATVSWLNR